MVNKQANSPRPADPPARAIPKDPRLFILDHQEICIVALVALGYQEHNIAFYLGLNEIRFRAAVLSVLQKLEVQDLAGAAAIWKGPAQPPAPAA